MPPLDELYLRWLYGQVADIKERRKDLCYWKLLKQLFTTPFLWFIPNDDNRVEDGKALRREFLAEQAIDPRDVDPDWIELECSVLELMVRLSRDMAFEADGQPHYWFWVMMENIGLRNYHDGMRRYPRQYVDDILQTIIFRQYDHHGHGGFFPLKGPCEDQRKVELWYQLAAYVLENT